MAFWDEITKGAKDAAAFTMKKTEEITNLAKVKLAIHSEESKLDKCYSEIGELYYDFQRKEQDHATEIAALLLEADELKKPHLCDKCGECIKACPGKAIDQNGKVDDWRCAVYYNGANGTKNPFMPKDAFSDFEDRLEIIAGEAQISPEKARKILDSIFFYPPAQHAYQSSICGRSCDVACYIHLEERGMLTKKFNTPIRKREEWKFDIESFK